MSRGRATYLDSSAIIKLIIEEDESRALRHYLRRRVRTSSALARTEVARTLRPHGAEVVLRGLAVLRELDLLRVDDRILTAAGALVPDELRTLDAIHVATAQSLGEDLARLCTYDQRMADAATAAGLKVVAPA